MALLWAGFGLVVGVSTTPLDRGTLAMVSGALAGLIVLPPLGVVLGLLGGQVKETQAGALLGLCCLGGAGWLIGSANVLYLANLGLLTGAMAGATVFGLLRTARQVAAVLTARS
jgi:hypothetical protein